MNAVLSERGAASGALEIRPLTDALGAEIFGVDLREPLSAALTARIRAAFNKYGVIFFRDQPLSPQQFIDFTRSIGEPAPSTAMPAVPGFA